MAMDAYGQLVGLEPYYLFDSIILLIEDVLLIMMENLNILIIIMKE